MFDAIASQRIWFLICGVIGGYLMILLTNPVREGLRDGWRVVRRYPSLWILLGGLAFLHSIFQLGVRLYFHLVLPPADRPEFVWLREAWRDPDLRLAGSSESLWWLPRADFLQALRDSRLPALESVAGIFNMAVATFPFAALAAVLLLANWQGHHAVLNRALRNRFGGFGWFVHVGIVVCALAAVAKPLLYAAPLWFGLGDNFVTARAWFQWAPVIEWLAFLFEYLFGVFVQLYLILLAFVWVRGLTFTHQHLVDFALRRSSYVAKWAAIVMLLSSVFINAPLILKNFAPFAPLLPEEFVVTTWQKWARFGLAVFLLLTATMQITLTFHSESWRRAMRSHLRFLARCGWPFAWFLLVAAFHFFLLHALNFSIASGVGEGTALWVAWQLVFPWIAGVVTAWLLAAWVCVFYQCDTDRTHTGNEIQF